MENQVLELWETIDRQDWDRLPAFFAPEAEIFWHNTNEAFTVPEFVRANREYPGDWSIRVERTERAGGTVISVARVRLRGEPVCFHAVSFFRFSGERILRLDEYWGDDGPPPQWRVEKRIGRPIAPREPDETHE